MKKTSIWFIAIIFVFSMIIVGAGCKPEATEEAEEVVEEVAEEVEEEVAEGVEEVIEEEKSPEDYTGTVTYWSWLPRPETQWPDVIEAFNAKYPNITIEFERLKWADYVVKLKTAMLGGEGPDVFALQSGDEMGAYVELIEPLGPYAEAAWGKNWEDNYQEFAIAEAKGFGEDYPWLPINIGGWGAVMYDADLFEQVGAEPFTSYEELKEVIQKFKDNPIEGILPNLGVGWGNKSFLNGFFYKFANENEPDIAYNAGEGNASWTDPAFFKALEFMKSLIDDNIMQEGALTTPLYPDVVYDMFITNARFPMILTGSYTTTEMLKQAKEAREITDRRFGVIPLFDSSGNNAPQISFSVNQFYAINKDTENMEAAWKWVEWSMTEAQPIFQSQLESLACMKGVPLDTSGLEYDIEKETVEELIDFISTSDFYKYSRRALAYPELEDVIFENVQLHLLGQFSAEEALNAIEDFSQTLER